MIHALHLLWIIPLAVAFGYVLGAIMAVGKQSEDIDIKK
jgi:hypothetical protein